MEYWIYINNYLYGRLNNKESIQFELDVSINSDLRNELELVLTLFDLLEQMVRDFEYDFMDAYSEEIPLSILYAVYGINCNTGELLPTDNDLVSDIPEKCARDQRRRIKLNYQMSPLTEKWDKVCLIYQNICVCFALLLIIFNKAKYTLKTHIQWNH